MKKTLKRMIACICILTLGAGAFQVMAAQGDHFNNELSAVTHSYDNNKAFNVSSTETDGLQISWDVPLYADATLEADSGIYLNGELMPNALMKKIDGAAYYVECSEVANVGDIVTIKGTFGKSALGETVSFKAVSFRFDGSAWSKFTKTNYYGKLSYQNAADCNASAVYLYSEDAKTPDSSWGTAITALNDTSGIFVNGDKKEGAYLKKLSETNYYVSGFDTLKSGDILSIKGAFGNDSENDIVTFEHTNFQWDGSSWSNYNKTVYAGELYSISMADDKSFVRILSTDKKPIVGDDGWNIVLQPVNNQSGVYINGKKLANAEMKKISTGEYYIAGFGQIKDNDILTIRGIFGPGTNDEYVALSQVTLQWTSENWIISNKVNYIGELSADSGDDNHIELLTTDSKPSDGWDTPLIALNENSGIYVNGSSKPDGILKKTDYNKYFSEGFGTVTTGDILTISGSFGNADQNEIVSFSETYFLWNGSTWENYTIVDFEGELSYQNGPGAATFAYLKTTDKKPIDTWDIRFVAQDSNSGIYVNGSKMSDAYFQKVGGQCYFTNFGTLEEGDVVSIKGTFGSQGVIGTIIFSESTFQWIDDQWTNYTKTNYIGELSCATENGKANHLYVETTDEKPHDESWNTILTAKNKNSGIYINDEKVPNAQMKKYAANKYYVENFTANEGDVLTICGLFGNDAEADTVTLAKAKFQFEGNMWIEVTEGMSYTEGKVWIDTEQSNTEAFLYLGGSANVHESYENDFGWINPVGTTGVYKNGEPCTATVKNINTNAWFIDFSGAGIKAGDKITIKGTFGYNESYVKVSEYNLWYTSEGWIVMYGDATGDGELNSLDVARLKRHLAGQDVDIDPTGADADGVNGINEDDRITLYDKIIKNMN